MSPKYIKIITLFVLCFALHAATDCNAQSRRERRQERRTAKSQPLQIPSLSGTGFTVKGGERFFDNVSDSLAKMQSGLLSDSLPSGNGQLPDSLLSDNNLPAESVSEIDSFTAAMSKRERRQYERDLARLDTMNFRHHPMFRDTLLMGTSFAISLVAPGFQQFYNQQYWKIPVLYATMGTAMYFGIREHRVYKAYKRDFDYLRSVRANNSDIYPIQYKMLQHNTARQLFFFAALGSYIYFLGDGLLNYPTVPQERVQTATLLSTICPGAGQIYNESYWRAPVFFGMGAATIYIVDFNNRGYQRYKTAYQYRTDGDDSTVDEFEGRLDEKYILNLKQSYRRNRDLAIILTGVVYLLNIMDAHVDAHLRTFDISDDLSYRIQIDPMIAPLYTQARGMDAMVGVNVCIKF